MTVPLTVRMSCQIESVADQRSPTGSVRRKWINYFTVIILFFFFGGGGRYISLFFFRIHLNEFEDTRMNWGSAFFLGGEDLRMNWKTYQKKAEPQFIRVSSNSFRCMPSNSFVCLPIHSYVFSPKKSRNPNSFVCLPIHS